jgi:hypothetical protein
LQSVDILLVFPLGSNLFTHHTRKRLMRESQGNLPLASSARPFFKVCGPLIADGRLSIGDCFAIDPPIRMAGQSAIENAKAADLEEPAAAGATSFLRLGASRNAFRDRVSLN